jgi:hypothetical protein
MGSFCAGRANEANFASFCLYSQLIDSQLLELITCGNMGANEAAFDQSKRRNEAILCRQIVATFKGDPGAVFRGLKMKGRGFLQDVNFSFQGCWIRGEGEAAGARSSGCEPNELPGCSTPQSKLW